MDEIRRPLARPGPVPVNVACHLSRRKGSAPTEYIEISSSSSSSSGNSDDEDLAQLQPRERRNYRLKSQTAFEPHPHHQPSTPSMPDQIANRAVPAAARGLDSSAIERSAADLLVQQNLMMGPNEVNLNGYFDYLDALDIRDADLPYLLEEQLNAEMAARSRDEGDHPVISEQAIGQPPAAVDPKDECLSKVKTVFPDICVKHVSDMYDTMSHEADMIVAHILENMDEGIPYPKARDAKKTLKRKRELDEDEEAALKYDAVDRPANTGSTLQRNIRTILSVEFPETPMAFIEVCLRRNGYRMFSTYRILEEAERTYNLENPPYNKIKSKRRMPEEYQEANLRTYIAAIPHDQQRIGMLQEFQAARGVRKNAEAKREEERQLELEEQANVAKARSEGTMLDCQCCFGDYPMNRMVHCNNEEVLHWFCKGCATQNAETVIGQSKYQLVCMAMEGCASSFSMAQRSRFLDEKTAVALERNEQEANLRLAGIENLASCPFCPYAAEYPPVEIDKEFRCESPECEKVSCRLCKLESHIPKSCKENKELGLSVRRQIEEAMSEALIRRCNKCRTPFVKEEGCNKMTCTRPGCGNVQCYVCSKSCAYSHFNDESRGGKTGNCPLFEKTSQRHEDEVKKAEKDALEKIRAEHPEFTEEYLTVKVSEAVLQDEKRRQAAEALPRQAGPHAYHGHQIFRGPRHPGGIPLAQNLPNIPAQIRAAQDALLARFQQQTPAARKIGAMPIPMQAPLLHYNALFIDNKNIMALPGSLENQALAMQNPPAGSLHAPGMLFPPAPPAIAPHALVLQPLALGAQRIPEQPMYQPLPQHQQLGHIADPKNYINSPPQIAAQHFMNPLEHNQEYLGAATYLEQQFRQRVEQYQANSERNQDPFAAAIHNNLQQNNRRLDHLTLANQVFPAGSDKRGGSVAEMTGNIAPARPDGQLDTREYGHGMNAEDD